VLSGTWSFASGCDASSWVKLGAFITAPGAKPPFEGAFFLLPIGDCEIVDNWFVCGLAGTGSKDIVVREVFVPAHRILLFSDARSGTAPGAKHHRNPLYRMPLLIHGASMLASTAVGAARGALDAYLEMTRTRKTRGALAGGQLPMVEFATIQLRYAEAAAAVESAELILLTDMRNMSFIWARRSRSPTASAAAATRPGSPSSRCRRSRRSMPRPAAMACISTTPYSAHGAMPTPWPVMSASTGMRWGPCTVSIPLVSNRAVSIS